MTKAKSISLAKYLDLPMSFICKDQLSCCTKRRGGTVQLPQAGQLQILGKITLMRVLRTTPHGLKTEDDIFLTVTKVQATGGVGKTHAGGQSPLGDSCPSIGFDCSCRRKCSYSNMAW